MFKFLHTNVFALGVGIFFCLASPAVADQDQSEEIDRLVKAFDVIVFGSDIRNVRPRENVLKWSKTEIPFNLVWLRNNGSPGRLKSTPVKESWRDSVAKHLNSLTKITDLKFVASVSARKRPALSVIFIGRENMARVPLPGVDRDLIQELAAPGRCYFLTFPNEEGGIGRTVVVVNSDLPAAHIEHCLLEELTQGLGLPSDTNLIRPSIFSDHDYLQSMSNTDEMLVRTLYHEKIVPGMARADALKVSRLIFGELLAAQR